MIIKNALLAPCLAAIFFASAALAQESLPDAPQATAAASIAPNGPTVVMDTSMGRITCQFFQKESPKAVATFIALAQGTRDWTDPSTKKLMHHKPLFDGTIFHRVIPDFMIQGGDPSGTGMGDPGFTFADEFYPDLGFDVPGRLAEANSGPNTNGSQFFITEVPTPHLNHHHTVLGQCDEPSLNVVKTIARVQVNRDDKPLVPVVLRKVTIVPAGQPLPPRPGQTAPAATPSKPAQPQPKPAPPQH
jgi:peptidyl-prolyl cis-trans isomerase A (cyclophilin A)